MGSQRKRLGRSNTLRGDRSRSGQKLGVGGPAELQGGHPAKLADPILYQQLDKLPLRGERLLNELEHGHGTLSKLVTEDDLYRRADKVLSDVETLIADVKANPTKYFKITVF